MAMLKRLIRADDSRRTRFHDGKGRLHLHPDMARSAFSTFRRHALGIYPALPWLTYAAIGELRKLTAGRRVFEFGAGTSTIWFAANAGRVVSVENNADWFNRSTGLLAANNHVELLYRPDESAFLASLDGHAKFDIYLIDCQAPASYSVSTEDLRIRCLDLAYAHAGGDAIFIVDNTDVNMRLDARVSTLFANETIQRLPGWVPGIFHPNETTLIRSAGLDTAISSH